MVALTVGCGRHMSRLRNGLQLGVAMPGYVFIGNSHIGSLTYSPTGQRQMLPDGTPIRLINFNEIERLENSSMFEPDLTNFTEIIKAAIETAVSELGGDVDAVLLSLGGAEHHLISIIQSNTPYRLEGDPQASAQYIPTPVMKATLENKMSWMNTALDILEARFPAPKFFLEYPPPIASAEYILAHTPKAVMTPEIAITPVATRLSMHNIMREVVQDKCRERDITFIEVPPELKCEDGSLSEESYGNDWLHASVGFGDVFLSSISQVVGSHLRREAA
jgi:hypothetical protein